MVAATVDVVGSTPISFTNGKGEQKVVPLSAFQFIGTDIQLKPAWTSIFNKVETDTLLALAKARFAVGELTRPPVAPKAPAIMFSAAHLGPESNNITVFVPTEPDKPQLTAGITVNVTEIDTYPGLTTGAAAAHAIGVDTPTGKAGDPLAGTGLVVVKYNSTSGSAKPAIAASGVMKKGAPADLKDADGKVVLTLLPHKDYTGTGGLSYAVTVEGAAFELTVTYDSTKESGGAQKPVTLQTLDALPDVVAFLVTASAPPAGAALPADGSVQLSGGSTGVAASGLLYTS